MITKLEDANDSDTDRQQRYSEPEVPKLIEESEHVASTASSLSRTNWTGPFQPPPVVPQSTILGIGLLCYILAVLWPPLLLLVAYLASKLIPYSFRTTDEASHRRKLFCEFAKQDDLPEDFKTVPSHIKLEECYWVNSRGMALCSTIMTPRNQPIRAVAMFCHGYTDSVSFQKQVENQRFVEQGIAFCALEYEGHGRSDGPMGLIDDFDLLVDDVASFFQDMARKFPENTPRFIVGESMGGAVAFLVQRKLQDFFRGVVFVAPMCKISKDMLPPQWVIDTLIWLIGSKGGGDDNNTTNLLGYLPIAPAQQSLGDVADKVQAKKDLYARNPLCFCRNPRLATARELIATTQEISTQLSSLELPFLVVHGKDDRVTDPQLSQTLYDEAQSKDKTCIIYDGMWHGLTSTEPDENMDRVFGDIIQWMLDRC